MRDQGMAIKIALCRAGKSRKELAAHFNTHRATLAFWINNKTRINWDQIVGISEFCGIEPEEFISYGKK